MSKDEMRFLRREVINSFFSNHGYTPKMHVITKMVRLCERVRYGRELKAYK